MSVPASALPDDPDRLDLPEQFVLWAARQWVAVHNGQPGARARLAEGFACAYVDDARAPFERLMETMAAALRRAVDMRCPRCRALSADEALFLRIVAAAQHGRADIARAGLCELLAPAGARLALDLVLDVADRLLLGGVRLPVRQPYLPVRAASFRHPLTATVH